MVRDKNLIIAIEDLTEILDTCWPLDYKDTFNVPEGEALCFRGGGILVNGKNDVPGLKAFGEKEKAGKLLLRRSKLNRILAGETDCLNEPLTPEVIGQFERERDLIQEGIIKAVGPLLDPDSTITSPSPKTAENGRFKENNGGISLPPEIDTPEARNVFENALKAGYLEKTSTGDYQWKVSKMLPKVAAAYLCSKLYKHPRWKYLEPFLGLKYLKQSLNLFGDQFSPTPLERPWKPTIDALFED